MKKFPAYILHMAIIPVAILFLGMRSDSYRSSHFGYAVVRFTNYVGKQELKLDSAHYKNALGQDFTVTNFKYYVGNFKLYRDDSVKYHCDKYFLVRADDPESALCVLPMLTEGDEEFTAMSFTIGVDSLSNCSGAQSGALDPVNGMFWTWNSGYVFMKLEGKSPVSKSPGNIFEYHIGGYKAPANCIRTIKFNLKKTPLEAHADMENVVDIKTDILEILKNPMTVDFSKLSSVTDFHHAEEFADNYKDMFSVLKITNAY